MRLTEKDETFCFEGSGCNLHYTPKQPLKIDITIENINFVESLFNKLGQLEDILEKYEIDNLSILDKVLETQQFLSNHDYSTLPTEDFDNLFGELKKYKDIEEELGIDLITFFGSIKGTMTEDFIKHLINRIKEREQNGNDPN